MRALTVVKRALTKDVPEIFSGIVEVDETYLVGQWKNKRKTIRNMGTKRGRGTKKQPVFGI
ncbi:MAG: transposase [Methanoregula sp.]